MVDITALFSLSYGIYLLGTHNPDKPSQKGGCLVNTVFQITAEPVRIGVSVAKANCSHDWILKNGTVSVTVMDQTAGAKTLGPFGYRSSRDVDKLCEVCWHADADHDPLIEESAVAHLSCRVLKTVDIDTHTLFICDVTSAVKLSDAPAMTYQFYRDVKKGQSSKHAPTYVAPSVLK